MNSAHLLMAAGVLNGLFTIFHLFFWKIFNWPESLKNIGTLNQKMIPVFNMVTTYTLLVFSGACLFMAQDLASSALGRALCLAMAGFWVVRTVGEFIYGDIRTKVSQVLVALFLIIAGLTILPLYMPVETI